MTLRRTALIVLVAAAMAFGASGCVAPAPVPTPASTTAGPTATPTATPAPSPSPTPSLPATGSPYVPDDPTTWIIDFDGVGPVKIGDTIDEVTASIPVQGESCRPGVAQFFGSSITAVGGDTDDPTGGTAAVLMAIVGQSMDATTGYPSTAAGITIGSTIAELQAAYPDLESYQTSTDSPYRITDGTHWIHFTGFGTDVVKSITVSTLDQTPKEYCG